MRSTPLWYAHSTVGSKHKHNYFLWYLAVQFIATYLASLKIHHLAIQYINNIIPYISLQYFMLSICSLNFYNTVAIIAVLGVEINYKQKIEYILK
jgi:hypothetical protein